MRSMRGYNCTIFAYGQTGTGKTYTMEGGKKTKNGEFPSDADVIPRAVRQNFDILEAQNAEYSMKVTFLELYNKEIMDLLVQDESKFMDDKTKKPIALMEDGKGVFLLGDLKRRSSPLLVRYTKYWIKDLLKDVLLKLCLISRAADHTSFFLLKYMSRGVHMREKR